MKSIIKISAFILFFLLANYAIPADATTHYFGGAKKILSATTETVAAGYYDATTLHAVDNDLATGNIKKDINIFGIGGIYVGAGGTNYGLPKTGQQPGLPAGTPFHAGDDCSYASPESHDVGYPRGMLTWAGYNTARFTGNGDGTVTDNATDLMWEQKTTNGSLDIHDRGNTYTWANAFDVFIAGVNAENFAGHNDWRLPNRFELISILDLGRKPSINPVFVNTQNSSFWSATTRANATNYAWRVSFDFGNADSGIKTSAWYARAVRPVLGGVLPPILTTTAVSNITANTASSGGNIISGGGAPVTARGVCWNTTGSPTTAESKTTDGSGTGSFTSSLTGLTAGTTYYIRAYATNSAGTAYGNEVSFTTTPAVLATLTTATVTNIGSASATSGGDITNDGGAPVTARGVCWNTTGSPTTAESKTTDGSGTGIFTSNLTGLTPLTTYYVRAYATNSAGTAYGNEVSFKASITSIGATYAGGIVFYIDGTGQHGLVAAPSDLPGTSAWSNITSTLIGTTGTAIGSGESNTNAIIGQSGHTASAAKLCYDLVVTSEGTPYSDWFLPSKDEIYLLYAQRVVVGGFANGGYWSSSEYANNLAWFQYFTTNGDQLNYYKYYPYYVRAVRAF